MDNFPKGLPGADPSAQADTRSAIDKSRICLDCGKEMRIISNDLGVSAFCATCKKRIPISSTPMAMEIPMTFPRGLSKQTFVEPDWNQAFEDSSGDRTHEQIGPKRNK